LIVAIGKHVIDSDIVDLAVHAAQPNVGVGEFDAVQIIAMRKARAGNDGAD
jgi:hypothetical protein